MPQIETRWRLAERLKALLDGPLAPEDKESAWQDSLDLLALAAGSKRVALIGCGYEAGAWLASIADLARTEGFAVRRGGMPWLLPEEFAGLPAWYQEPVRDGWASAEMLTLCRPEEAARFAGATALVTPAEEAGLLAYPPCCVQDHHQRRRLYHDLMVELVAARCDCEEGRRRFVQSEAMPPLRDDADRRRLTEALSRAALPYAGFVPCPACEEAGPQSAAAEIDVAMRALADANGLPRAAER